MSSGLGKKGPLTRPLETHLTAGLAAIDRARPPAVTQTGASSYRPEIQGLRAFAVLLVVVYHIWFDRVSGGVDVFLLISSFLLTLSFLRMGESGLGFKLRRYWSQVFSRLLPAAATVMLGTLAATLMFVPQSRWGEILDQTWASLFYVQNWLLAERSVDYYAADDSLSSPLQHFWSLSIQGQIFILWPLLFALCAVLARLGKFRFRLVVVIVFGAVFCASLAYSVVETYTNQSYAYFDTRARLWEFALGTLLAAALPYISLPRSLRLVIGWIALVAIVSGGFILDVQREFPGYIALWPLLAAGAIMVAGPTGSRFGADRLLSWKPLVRVGDFSYALYLWHWPVMVIYLIARSHAEVGLLSGAAIIGVSLVLAYLTMRFVENPLRAKKRVNWRYAAAIIVASCLIVALPLAAWQGALKIQADRLSSQTVADNPGARVLSGLVEPEAEYQAAIIPAAADIQGEWASLSAMCSVSTSLAPEEDRLTDHCSHNGIDPATSERTLVVVGDSHAEQWLGVMRPLAEQNEWTLVALLDGGCDFGAPAESRGAECKDFNEAALAYIGKLKPDAVFAVATEAHPDTAQDTVVPGFPAASKTLLAQGIEVIGIRDNPRYSFNMMSCLNEANGDVTRCARDRDATLNNNPPFGEILSVAPATLLLDATDLICSVSACEPVVGNTYVYIDSNHLTETYVESMYPAFLEMFREVTGWADLGSSDDLDL